MSAKLTPWFPCHVRPVHIGYYETQTEWTNMVLYWNGYYWMASEKSPSHSNQFSCIRDWRGLAANPAKVAK